MPKTIADLIAKAITESGGRATLSQIYGVVTRSRPNTIDQATRGVLYRERNRGAVVQNSDTTWSLTTKSGRQQSSIGHIAQKSGLKRREADMYEPVKTELQALFEVASNNGQCHLEITSRGQFSYELKDRVPESRNIVFAFLEKRKAFPDITGWIEGKDGNTEFITVEIKDQAIELDDIYQAKKYSDLFGAKYGLLISDQRLPPELKRLNRAANMFYQLEPEAGQPDSDLYDLRKIYFAQFDLRKTKIMPETWFPANPFTEDSS